jgi:uracil-DNA glycosylase family 4
MDQADVGLIPDVCLPCGLFRECKSPWLLGRGPKDAEILGLFEAPGPTEDAEGAILIGPSGKKQDAIFARANMPPIRLENVVLCYPKHVATPKMNHIRACRGFWIALAKRMPNLKKVICFGRIAIASVLDEEPGTLTKYRLSALKIPEFPDLVFFATYHPSYVRRNPQAEAWVLEDLDFAIRWPNVESEPDLPDISIPQEDMSGAFWSVLDSSRPIMTIDLEHTGLLINNANPWPKNGKVADLLLVCWKTRTDSGSTRLDVGGLPEPIIQHLKDPKAITILQNAPHELAWLHVNYGLWPAGTIFDVMIAFHLLDENYPTRSLEGIVKHLFHRDMAKEDFWRTFHLSGIDWPALTQYCMQDVIETEKAAKLLALRLRKQDLDKLFVHEMANRLTMSWARILGTRYNLEKAEVQAQQCIDNSTILTEKLRQLAGNWEFNPNAPGQVLEVLQRYNSRITSSDVTNLRRLLNRQPENTFALHMLEYRRLQSELRYLNNYKSEVYDDGLMHPDFQPTTETGRLRCSGPNMLNVMR